MNQLTLGPEHGELTVHTGVSGQAARLGHSLTLTFPKWEATVTLDGDGSPRVDSVVGIDVTVETRELAVTSGTGGVSPLTDIDRGLIRRAATKGMKVRAHPEATFKADAFQQTESGLVASGTLSIAGVDRPTEINIVVSDRPDNWQVVGNVAVRQKEFGIKPHSIMLGALSVADEVTVRLVASIDR